ncbi:MAG TPA: CHASE3 domain-containing protein, partial [Chthoniobacterales bacterium]|nr:CHASE3 domain-containing protein [Chthoniobacterales bacterium]
MPDPDTPTAETKQSGGVSESTARGNGWLFSQRHFHLKLLSGTAVGITVIVFLAGLFVFVTLRNHRQDVLRKHTIEVLRLGSVIENDLAALETGHRGYLLTGKANYLQRFQERRELVQKRSEDLTGLNLDSPIQRKRVMKVQEIVQKWLNSVAVPEMNARQAKPPTAEDLARHGGDTPLGNSLLDQAREILQSLQDDEQIVLNQRVRDQELASQTTQILDFIPKLERSVVEMEKEKRGYLLTGDAAFSEGYRRATAAFYSYHGYVTILVANSPGEAELLAKIRKNVESWMNSSAAPEMEARRLGRDLTALAVADKGEALMSDIRRLIGDFEKNELSASETRSA